MKVGNGKSVWCTRCKMWVVALVALVGVCGCTEEIDMSNRYTFTEETIVSYLEQHEQYSEYVRILQHVPVSRVSRSTLYQLLTARGYYTCFAPTNEAIQLYLEQLTREGLIASPSWDAFETDRTRDSIYAVIAKNSIIDGGDSRIFETTEFPAQENGEFPLANMNERKMTVRYGENPDSIYINRYCKMSLTNRNIPTINGVIHAMDNVIAPSEITLGALIDQILVNHKRGFLVMARLVEACGMKDSLNKFRDERYEDMRLRGEIEDFNAKAVGWTFHGATGWHTAYAPEHRKFGFTIFCERDDFWEEAIGKSYEDITAQDVKEWILANHQFSRDDVFTQDDNYESADNILNQWLTYHMLPMRIPTNRLVFHVNEKGYNFKTSTAFTIPVMEYYTTMGKRRLLKIYESRESQGIYLNRFPNLDLRRRGSGREIGCEAGRRGCRINTEGEDVLEYETVNGMLYGIDAPLAYTDEVRDNLLLGRIRFDGMSLFPEAMNNDLRKKESTEYTDQYVYFPSDNIYHYLENMWMNEQTHFVYLNSYGYDWCNLQQDEMKACGQYDITIKLPPVPRHDVYELRYRVLPTPERGVIQFYFGSDRTNLAPTGIPIDLRVQGNSSVTGWEADLDDEDHDAEVDKKMRNNNRMKGEESVWNSGGTARSAGNAHIYRYILTRQRLDPDKTYYLRMKSVLESEVTEFYMDYLEWCPKEVYDNPRTPEDIW